LQYTDLLQVILHRIAVLLLFLLLLLLLPDFLHLPPRAIHRLLLYCTRQYHMLQLLCRLLLLQPHIRLPLLLPTHRHSLHLRLLARYPLPRLPAQSFLPRQPVLYPHPPWVRALLYNRCPPQVHVFHFLLHESLYKYVILLMCLSKVARAVDPRLFGPLCVWKLRSRRPRAVRRTHRARSSRHCSRELSFL
jgi:hypothetical protein